MMAATNCPVRDASLEVQGRVCRLFKRLSEGVPLAPGKVDVERFDMDVASAGGLQLATTLCLAVMDIPRSSPCHNGQNGVLGPALGLVALASKRHTHSDKSALGDIVEVAQKLFDSEIVMEHDTAEQAVRDRKMGLNWGAHRPRRYLLLQLMLQIFIYHPEARIRSRIL